MPCCAAALCRWGLRKPCRPTYQVLCRELKFNCSDACADTTLTNSRIATLILSTDTTAQILQTNTAPWVSIQQHTAGILSQTSAWHQMVERMPHSCRDNSSKQLHQASEAIHADATMTPLDYTLNSTQQPKMRLRHDGHSCPKHQTTAKMQGEQI